MIKELELSKIILELSEFEIQKKEYYQVSHPLGVFIYNKGGIKNEVLSPLIFPLNLSEKEVNQVVEFLKTLTGSNIDVLISDAHAAPIGDVSLQDPNWFHENKLKY